MERVSCRDRLKELQKECNFKREKKKYKEGIPIIDTSDTKKTKKAETKIKKHMLYERLKQYTMDVRVELLMMSEEEMLQALYNLEHYFDIIGDCKYQTPNDKHFGDELPEEVEWKRYQKYINNKKIESISDINSYRHKFKTKKNKISKKFKKNGMCMYDPLFKGNNVDKKQMLKNIKKISEDNEKRSKAFFDMLDGMMGDSGSKPELIKQFNDKTSDIQKSMKKYLKCAEKSILDTSTTIHF